METLQVVPARSKEWTDEQMEIVNRGIEATNGSVPAFDAVSDPFLVLAGDKPVGVFTVMPLREDAVEVGVRFWEDHPTAGRVMGRGLAELFERYEYVVARCYANNMRVRRLLQRAAFILLGTEVHNGRSLHVYGCRKVDFWRVVPKGMIKYG